VCTHIRKQPSSRGFLQVFTLMQSYMSSFHLNHISDFGEDVDSLIFLLSAEILQSKVVYKIIRN
jgi:hypothetical protein